jgi:AcrR family transcriptional regulator
VSTSPAASTRARRRGPALEAALLDAAWEELVGVGFSRLTMESVAARASTGVAVLYRRWDNKDQLVLAALEHYGRNHPPAELADTGSLRGDLLDTLTEMGKAGAPFFGIAAAAAFSGIVAGTGLTPAQVRDRVLGPRRLTRFQTIYQRAHDRGEIDLQRVPLAVRALPFELLRHDLLMTLEPVKRARIRSIVDDLALPLIRSAAAGTAR